jgi:hypothetical protein
MLLDPSVLLLFHTFRQKEESTPETRNVKAVRKVASLIFTTFPRFKDQQK